MADISKELDPDQFKRLDKFRDVSPAHFFFFLYFVILILHGETTNQTKMFVTSYSQEDKIILDKNEALKNLILKRAFVLNKPIDI